MNPSDKSTLYKKAVRPEGNFVRGGETILLPHDANPQAGWQTVWTLDENAGDELFYVVLAKKPIPDDISSLTTTMLEGEGEETDR